MPLADGALFAGYRIVRLLGSGGMGEVYLAQHPRLPRQDALKVLPELISTDSDFRERFDREAELAARLFHPHIVGVHDRGEFDGRLWISMDYVEGTDAAQLMRSRYPAGMHIEEVLAIVTAVAGALDYAHQRGLLHRDVKPSNILLTEPDDDGERRVLLADFGIARQLGDISGLTATNLTVGTVAYAAPEQLMGADLDGRADQYALAATAFHLLTGAPPYQSSNPVAVISQHLNAPLPKLSDRRPDLASLDEAMSHALSKNPAERFARCRQFAKALSEGVSGPRSSARETEARATTASPDATLGVKPPRPPWWQRQRAVLALIAAGLVAVASVIVVTHNWSPKSRTAGSPNPPPGPVISSNSPLPAAPSQTSPSPPLNSSILTSSSVSSVAPLPATPFAPLVGTWQGHHRGLTVSADGTIEMHIIDSAACPQCAAVDAPRATVHIGLTSYNGDNTDNKGRFGGYVKDSSDTRVVPAGLPVEVDVEPAGAYGARIGYRGSAPGRVMTISIKGMPVSDGWNFEPLGDASPFCDEAALGTVCGA
jgi:serine/threonine-protein kinase